MEELRLAPELRLNTAEEIAQSLLDAAGLVGDLTQHGLEATIRTFGFKDPPDARRVSSWGVRVNVEKDVIDGARFGELRGIAERYGYGFVEFHVKHGVTFRRTAQREAPPNWRYDGEADLIPFSEEAMDRAWDAHPNRPGVELVVASDLEAEVMVMAERRVAEKGIGQMPGWWIDTRLAPGRWDLRTR